MGHVIDIILFDTDVLIDCARGVPQAVEVVKSSEKKIGITAIVEMELLVGCRNNAERVALDRFLRPFTKIPVDEMISQEAVDLVRRYRLSHGLLIADALIAATALVKELPLLTKNQKHFRVLPGLKLLSYPPPEQ